MIGSIELVPLVDAVGKLGELAELFPGHDDWEPYRELYPDLFAGSQLRLPCTCYLLRSGGRTILIDTGVGPAGLWGWKAKWEEGLLPALAEAGTAPEDVDAVFLTHLHVDHVGWNTDRDARPVFPRARFVAHRDAVAFALESDRPHIDRCIRPLEFDVVETEETELADGVTAFALPGHYPGHMGVRVESKGARALLIADAAVHPMLLDRPDAAYISDLDAVESAATRRQLVPRLVEEDVVVICGHYPGGGIGRVALHEGRVVWEAL